MRRSVMPIVGSPVGTTLIGRHRRDRLRVPTRCPRSTRHIECSATRPVERCTTQVSGRRRRRHGRSHPNRLRATAHRCTRAISGPARVPWRSLLVVGIIGVIGVVVLAQFTEPGEPAGPDGILGVDSCVAIETNGFAREVLCTRDPAVDLVVTALVPFDATCPGGTEAHQDRQGMGIACIARP